MVYKFETRGGYFVITNTVNNSEILRKSLTDIYPIIRGDTIFFYDITSDQLLPDSSGYEFSEVIDVNGKFFTSKSELLGWVENNIGYRKANEGTRVIFEDSANFDAFSRLRTSQSKGLFDSQFTYDLQPLLFEQIASGGTIAHDTVNRNSLMTFTDAVAGSEVKMQTYEHFRYTSGKSQLIMITFNFNEAVANTLKFAGYTNGTEGVEFRLNGLIPEMAILSSTDVGNQIIAQSNWNLDKLDGTGLSRITLDISKAQILVIDFQALYVGRVRAGFDIDGKIFYVHEFRNANNTITNYLKTANLPLRCGMNCSDTVSTTINFICSTVIQEDGFGNSEGYDFTASGAVTAGNGTATHILSVQPKPTFNSIENRAKFILENFNILVTGNSPIKWQLCLGTTLSGTTAFDDVNTTYSTFATNTLGTLSGTPDIVVASGFISATAQAKGDVNATVPFKYPITLDASGAVREMGRLTLLVTGLGGTSACQASINWKEIR